MDRIGFATLSITSSPGGWPPARGYACLRVSFVYHPESPSPSNENVLVYGLCSSCVREPVETFESCRRPHRHRIAFPIKGAPPERTLNLTIIHPSYHTSTYLRAHQQAYLIRGTECTGQEVTDVKGSEYLLAHYHLLAYALYSLQTSLSLYRVT